MYMCLTGVIGLTALAVMIGLRVFVAVIDMFDESIPVIARANELLRGFACDIMHWHNGNRGVRLHNNLGIYSICSRCGRPVCHSHDRTGWHG